MQGAGAYELRDQIKLWDRDWRHHPGPAFSLHPADAAVPNPAVGRVFRKQHTQLVMAWT